MFLRRIAALLLVLAITAAACSSDPEMPSGAVELETQVAPESVDEGVAADAVVAARTEQEAPLRWRPLGDPGVGGRVTNVSIDPDDPERYLAAGDVLGVALSEDAGLIWDPAPGLSSYEASRFTHHPERPDEVWVGTMGGPHVSTDGGRTWSVARNGFPAVSDGTYTAPVEVVLFDPVNPSRLLAMGGSHREFASPQQPDYAIWESLDGGTNWQRFSNLPDGQNVFSAVWTAGPEPVLLAAGQWSGVFRSTDGGLNWTQTVDGLPHWNVRDLAAHPSDENVIWAALGENEGAPGGIHRSNDGGLTWTESMTGLTKETAGAGDDVRATSRYLTIVVSASNPDVLYTADASWEINRVYRSDDAGGSWRTVLDRANAPQTFYRTGFTAETLSISPTDPNRVILGNAEFLLGTVDGGQTWTDLASRAAADGTFIGSGWSGLVASDIVFDPDRPGEAWLAAYDGGQLLHSVNHLTTWHRPLLDWDLWGGAEDVAIDGDSIAVLLGQNGVFNGIARSDDGGLAWFVVAGADAGLPDRGEPLVGAYAIAVSGESSVAVIGDKIYRSRDSGSTWAVGSSATTVMMVGESMYIGTGEGIKLDGSLLPGSPTAPTHLALGPDEALYATKWRADSDAGLYRMRDGGWEQLSEDPFAFKVAIDPANPDHLLLATNDHPFHDAVASSGVQRSTDGGTTWAPLNDGLTNLRVQAIAFDPHTPGRAVIGTLGQGFWIIEGLPS